jgi:hypothetical protein
MKIVVSLLVAVMLAGCGVPALESPSPTPSLPDEPPEFPGSAGALPWREGLTVPSELREGHVAFAELEELQRAIGSYLSSTGGHGAQVTVGLLAPVGPDEASAYAFVTGAGDDSVAGDEYRFTLRRSSDGWFVADLRLRTHCWRGVSEGLCV